MILNTNTHNIEITPDTITLTCNNDVDKSNDDDDDDDDDDEIMMTK